MNPALLSVLYSLIAGASTIIGIQVLVFRESLARKYSDYFMSFAAGSILAIALVHLMPEALELNPKAFLYMTAGFIAFYLIETVLLLHPGPEMHHLEHTEKEGRAAFGTMVFIGLFVHSFIDGIIIGVGFEVNAAVGVLSALGIILHELPEGVSTFSVLVISMARKKALVLSYLVALATPAATVITVLFIGKVPDRMMGMLLALAAGSFIYVSASDLIPQTHQGKGYGNALFLVLGIVFVVLVSALVGG